MLQSWPDTKLSSIQISRVFQDAQSHKSGWEAAKTGLSEYSLTFQILVCYCVKWKHTYESQCKEKELGRFSLHVKMLLWMVFYFEVFPLTLAHGSGTTAEIRQIRKMSGFDGMLNSREKWEVGWGSKVRPQLKAFKIPNCKNQTKLRRGLNATPIFKLSVAYGILDAISGLKKEWSDGLSKWYFQWYWKDRFLELWSLIV